MKPKELKEICNNIGIKTYMKAMFASEPCIEYDRLESMPERLVYRLYMLFTYNISIKDSYKLLESTQIEYALNCN